ncbi:RNA helicase required for poly(A+) mRNA export, partial [Coemansia asiatica]
MSKTSPAAPRGKLSISLEDSGDELDGLSQSIQQLSTANTKPEQSIKPAADKKEPSSDDFVEQEVEVRLADIQADPNSPLYSVKSFDKLGLHENLLKGIYEMNFTKPSKIQERALPLLLANPPRNMIGQSQSGTGKTAAFVLTMLSRVDYDLQAPQA